MSFFFYFLLGKKILTSSAGPISSETELYITLSGIIAYSAPEFHPFAFGKGGKFLSQKLWEQPWRGKECRLKRKVTRAEGIEEGPRKDPNNVGERPMTEQLPIWRKSSENKSKVKIFPKLTLFRYQNLEKKNYEIKKNTENVSCCTTGSSLRSLAIGFFT